MPIETHRYEALVVDLTDPIAAMLLNAETTLGWLI